MKDSLQNIIKSLLVFISVLFCFSADGQIQNPVKWKYSVNCLANNEAELVLTATLEPGWHLYSQNIADGGPIPTSFTFTPNANYEKSGPVKEGKPITKYEESFEMDLSYFENSAVFKQKIKIKSTGAFQVAGSLEFMVCNDGQCLPPDQKKFTFNVDCGSATTPGTQAPGENTPGTNATGSNSPGAAGIPRAGDGSCSCDSIAALLKAAGVNASVTAGEVPGVVSGEMNLVADPFKVTLEKECGEGATGESYDSLWAIFLAGFIGGFIALITPCVFPMIPLTVSFFTKQSKTRRKGISNAITYSLAIIAIYVTLGLLITAIFGAAALNEMASNVYFNLIFFIVFVVFAFSFFGAFEITLPSSLINKADAASERGGLIGILFMAFTLGLVSFSCTGPIIGTLLVEAARGESYLGPAVGMFGFALALALPFGLFAAFPGWLNSLPKSGGWLNSVKVSLGFLELALALKFLSNVDLAYHWGFLRRELFIALWVVVFALWGLYLLGKLRFSHDSEYKHTGVPALMLAIIVLTFTLYLLPGIWGAPLKLVSGYLPPSYYTETSEGVHECPHNLDCFHDYEEGMKYAREVGKPVMIDFTGYACVNCRRMEDNVWSDAKVKQMLREDYVLISLYVDDKKPLPADQVFTDDEGEIAETYGEKWSSFQRAKFQTNSQPYYVLMDNEGKVLATPVGYTPEIPKYIDFLDAGLCRYKSRLAAGTAGR